MNSKRALGTIAALSAVWLGLGTARAAFPPLLQEVEAKYAKSSTLSAKFTQSDKSATTGKVKVSSGIIQFKKPGKFKWEIVKPDSSISVSNGIKAWHYTPPFDEEDRGQVVEVKASEVQTRLANALLSGSLSTVAGLSVKTLGPNSFSCVPKRGSAGMVRKAKIEVNPDSKLIWKVTLEHAGGNRSEITLSEIELGKPVADSVFDFKIPPNTDRAKP